MTSKLTPKVRHNKPGEHEEEHKSIEQRISTIENELKILKNELRALKNGKK
jgi:hypothetical protein